MNHNDAAMFLQQFYTTLSHSLESPWYMYRQTTQHDINKFVEREVIRIKTNYALDEQRYVEQMLMEHPVIVERRPSVKTTGSSSEEPRRPETLLQKQRAESCRKSRINNKIKKSKSQFRHQYLSNQLANTAAELACLRKKISQSEQKLVCSGYYAPVILEQLQKTFGVDQSIKIVNS